MGSVRLSSSIESWGKLGNVLSQWCPNNLLDVLIDLSYERQIRSVGSIYNRLGEKAALAASLLACDFPIQVPCNKHTLATLVEASLEAPGRPRVSVAEVEANAGVVNWRKKYFPLKTSHPGATNKVNVYLSEVLEATRGHEERRAGAVSTLSLLAGRAYDDQASAALLHGIGLAQRYGPVGYEWSARMVLDPNGAKLLSTAIKSLGANGTLDGAVLVEGETLQGRGVAAADLLGECRRRVDQSLANSTLAVFDEARLEEVVSAILTEEIADMPTFVSPEELWERRWLWCANGSHGRLLERNRPGYAVREIPGVTQWYRRMFAEATEYEPITGWDGEVFVSASPKLEHGKTRTILACDSVSYFCFEHLLGPVEQVWRGRRVVLDPGSSGHAGMAAKVRELRKRGAISVMLDYDDFNSQHTLSAQKCVIRSLCRLTGYPPDLAAKLVSSFDRMQVHLKGVKIGTAVGTLMSGHRATSFLNSVLNAAYIRLSCGEELYKRVWCMHVGDDVYMSCPTYTEAGGVVTAMRDSPCKMNPRKQSVGSVCAEFLRVAVNDVQAVGYLARAVSATVSGNWVAEAALDKVEALRMMIQACRTLYNRSGGLPYAPLLARSCARMVGTSEKKILPMLRGEVGIGGSPVYMTSGSYRSFEVSPDLRFEGSVDLRQVPSHATEDYLTNVVTEVERYALVSANASVKSAMLQSSYGKALARDKPSCPGLHGHMTLIQHLVGSIELAAALGLRPKPGVLCQYPLLQLMKSRLTGRLLREVVQLAGGNPSARNIQREAWGPSSTGLTVLGFVSYSDACTASNKTVAGVLYSTHQTYV